MVEVDIVPMQTADLEEVLEIERQAYSTPWPAQLFLEDLAKDWAHIDLARMRDGTGEAVAYCNYWVVHDEVHLLNVATHPDYRRRGIGNRLMRHLLAVARAKGCRFITLEVRRSNTPAQMLYRAHGFEAMGVRRRYYADNGEDAVVMTLELRTAG